MPSRTAGPTTTLGTSLTVGARPYFPPASIYVVVVVSWCFPLLRTSCCCSFLALLWIDGTGAAPLSADAQMPSQANLSGGVCSFSPVTAKEKGRLRFERIVWVAWRPSASSRLPRDKLTKQKQAVKRNLKCFLADRSPILTGSSPPRSFSSSSGFQVEFFRLAVSPLLLRGYGTNGNISRIPQISTQVGVYKK